MYRRNAWTRLTRGIGMMGISLSPGAPGLGIRETTCSYGRLPGSALRLWRPRSARSCLLARDLLPEHGIYGQRPDDSFRPEPGAGRCRRPGNAGRLSAVRPGAIGVYYIGFQLANPNLAPGPNQALTLWVCTA